MFDFSTTTDMTRKLGSNGAAAAAALWRSPLRRLLPLWLWEKLPIGFSASSRGSILVLVRAEDASRRGSSKLRHDRAGVSNEGAEKPSSSCEGKETEDMPALAVLARLPGTLLPIEALLIIFERVAPALECCEARKIIRKRGIETNHLNSNPVTH